MSVVDFNESSPAAVKRGGAVWLVLPLIPIIVVVAIFASVFVADQIAGQKLRRLVGEAERAGELSAVLVQPNSADSAEIAAEWDRAARALHGIEARFADRDELRPTIRGAFPQPGGPWEAGPLVRRFVEEAQPILNEIDRLLEQTDDVQTVAASGMFTARRSVVNLMRDELAVAVRDTDQREALRVLDRMDRLEHVLNDDEFTNSHLALIRRTLETDFWGDEELDELVRMLEDSADVQTLWHQYRDNNRRLVLRSYDVGSDARNPNFASTTNTDRLLTMMEFGDDPVLTAPGTLDHTLEAMDRWLSHRSSVVTRVMGWPFTRNSADYPMTSLSRDSWRLSRNATIRRWTRTAIGIRQFHRQQGRWPHALTELNNVGVMPTDLLARRGEQFGYDVSDDGSQALLWTIDVGPGVYNLGERHVGPEPPSKTGINAASIHEVEFRALAE